MKTLLVVVVSLFLVACAGMGANYRPLVDARGQKSAQQYEIDVRECQQYAAQTAGVGERAAVGVVAGALIGTVIAAAFGHGASRNRAAAVGATSGGISGATQGEESQRDVIKRCMAGRGYSVLR